MISRVESKSNELVSIFHEQTGWNLARVKFFVLILSALCKVQTVGFEKLATAFDSNASTSCVQYFEQQSYSPLRIERYKFLWKRKLIPFMVQNSFLNYDPSVGEEFMRSKIAGSMVTPYERDIIRSVNVLSEFHEKGTISKTRCKLVKRELCGQIGRLMDKFLMHLEFLRRNRITISDHRLYLYRFLFYLDSKQITAIEEVLEENILSFVSSV